MNMPSYLVCKTADQAIALIGALVPEESWSHGRARILDVVLDKFMRSVCDMENEEMKKLALWLGLPAFSTLDARHIWRTRDRMWVLGKVREAVKMKVESRKETGDGPDQVGDGGRPTGMAGGPEEGNRQQ